MSKQSHLLASSCKHMLSVISLKSPGPRLGPVRLCIGKPALESYNGAELP